MADLRVNYMGLELKNPVIAGASNMVTNPENLKRIEKAGAAAIVYKSLFEEQVQLENLELHERITEYEDRHAEMTTLFPGSLKKAADLPLQHLRNLELAKKTVTIPVIASLNALNDETWVEYARKIEETGVDGLELNFYRVPEMTDADNGNTEKNQVNTFKKVRAAVKIPVAIKLSPFYTNPLRFITELDKAGASAFVLFNRLFQPDIDVGTEKHHFPYNLSNVQDHRLPLRFAGLLYGNINASVCSNSGIFNGHDVIKMILAGADAVQVVSTLYLNQIEVIDSILREIEKWMDGRGYENLEAFRGKLSGKQSNEKTPYMRAQYIDYLMNTTEILKKYKVIS